MTKPRDGYRHAGQIDAHVDSIKRLLAEEGGALVKSRTRLAERGVPASASSRSTRSRVTKKTWHAIVQDRPDVLRQRQRWFDGQLDLDPLAPSLHRRDLDRNEYNPQP